jgi:CRP/FNR family transcriptional regulator
VADEAAVAALKAQPYFRSLDDEECKRLARALIERTFEKDHVVFLESDPCQGLYIVREGSVKIYKLSPEGREQVLTSVQAGGSFNEVAVFDGGPNPANVAAIQRTTLWIVPRAAIIDLIRRRPDVALAIIQNLGARLRHLVSLVEDLSLRHVSSRLAKLLLETASGREHALTQQEMAARLGTVREMIGRSLRQLEARGLIKIERGRIVIVDRQGLEKMV